MGPHGGDSLSLGTEQGGIQYSTGRGTYTYTINQFDCEVRA